MELNDFIRDVPDFPKPGIIFKDITTLLKDPDAFKEAVHQLCQPYRKQNIDQVVGIESRGFIFGGAMAMELDTGFIPMRKPGKLPAETEKEEYALEYGTDAIEVHRDAIQPEVKILVVDDLLATGGTAAASIRLVKKLGGSVIGAAFLIELCFLNGREKLGDVPVHTLIACESE
ncbi:adenine phosphoribosyltransferase [bacterium]|nr:adenine phosphoribosyltransferase [bacterium]RQV97942.1 MAG: adenine phosphoribosyltransferase [bacterium]